MYLEMWPLFPPFSCWLNVKKSLERCWCYSVRVILFSKRKNTIKWWEANILVCANNLYCCASETVIRCGVWSDVFNMAQRTKDVNLLKPRNENCRFQFTDCLHTTASQECLTSDWTFSIAKCKLWHFNQVFCAKIYRINFIYFMNI